MQLVFIHISHISQQIWMLLFWSFKYISQKRTFFGAQAYPRTFEEVFFKDVLTESFGESCIKGNPVVLFNMGTFTIAYTIFVIFLLIQKVEVITLKKLKIVKIKIRLVFSWGFILKLPCKLPFKKIKFKNLSMLYTFLSV